MDGGLATHVLVLLVGAGGVGMMGLAFARAMFSHAPIVADDLRHGRVVGRVVLAP